MTQDLNSEIEKELTTFSGQTFNSPEESHRWLKGAFTRIAEKTVEAVKIVTEQTPDTYSDDCDCIQCYFLRGQQQAVSDQDQKNKDFNL